MPARFWRAISRTSSKTSRNASTASCLEKATFSRQEEEYPQFRRLLITSFINEAGRKDRSTSRLWWMTNPFRCLRIRSTTSRTRSGWKSSGTTRRSSDDRDLNNFRLLKELRVLAVGVIVTRMSELQELFDNLGKGPSHGQSTTHWKKLIPKVDGGGAGGCCKRLASYGVVASARKFDHA